MNWFGRKKDTSSNKPSAVSSTSGANGGGRSGGGSSASRTSTANTVVSLRESIATQEKRCVLRGMHHYVLSFYDFVHEFHSWTFLLSRNYNFSNLASCNIWNREAHLEKKIEQLTEEAKAKMAKKDKKGAFSFV